MKAHLFYKILKAKRYYFEAAIWITALLLLAFMPIEGEHYSLCAFHNLGIGFCPGCGLGHSINYLFHGQFEASFYAHPFGIPAVAILCYRIFIIFKQNKNYHTI